MTSIDELNDIFAGVKRHFGRASDAMRVAAEEAVRAFKDFSDAAAKAEEARQEFIRKKGSS